MTKDEERKQEEIKKLIEKVTDRSYLVMTLAISFAWFVSYAFASFVHLTSKLFIIAWSIEFMFILLMLAFISKRKKVK